MASTSTPPLAGEPFITLAQAAGRYRWDGETVLDPSKFVAVPARTH
jgi:hypothetical protein